MANHIQTEDDAISHTSFCESGGEYHGHSLPRNSLEVRFGSVLLTLLVPQKVLKEGWQNASASKGLREGLGPLAWLHFVVVTLPGRWICI